MAEEVTAPAQATTEAAAAPQVASTLTTEAPKTDAPVVETKTETTPEKQTTEAKKDVPEKYDLKLGEDSVLDASVVEKVAALAKERGLSNDDAQKILDQESANVAKFIEDRKVAWKEEVQHDKEIGGDAFPKNVELAFRVVNRFGTDTLKKELNRSGYGNHPELVRLLSRIGKAMSEDQLVTPGAQAATRKSMEDVFYGGNKQQNKE